jgi:hypothetical protein
LAIYGALDLEHAFQQIQAENCSISTTNINFQCRQGGCMLRISRLVCGLALVLLLLQAAPIVIAQSQDLVVDICTTPNRYWNKSVALKGHVIKVTPDPPGTNRGRYTLRDQSDKDIEILTDDLPAQGKVYIIHGVVEQRKAGDNVPVVRENSRMLAQPDTPMTAAPTASPAPSSPSSVRPAAPAAKGASKADIEEAVRKQLEKERAAQSVPPPVTPAPTSAPIPTPTPAEPAATSFALGSPLMIGLIVVVVLVVIAVIVVIMKKKPEAPAYAPAPAPMPMQSSMPPAATQASSATQVSSGSATMVASKGTEVFTRLGGELTVSEGPDRGRTFAIGKPTVFIGRSGQRKNDLELTDSTTSREQAKIIYNSADRSFKIINESTTNPTRVNSSTVDSAVLQDGDKIEFGNTVVRFKKT